MLRTVFRGWVAGMVVVTVCSVALPADAARKRVPDDAVRLLKQVLTDMEASKLLPH